jgi:alkylation response protein AidB-like acyl-CoA dehydrogenase
VRIPDANVLGGVDRGWQAATATLMNERVSLGAVRPLDDVPSTELLIDVAKASGQASDPVLQDALADLWMRQRAVSLLGERITAAILSGNTPGPEGSVAKLVRTDFGDRSAKLAASIAGPRAAAWLADTPNGDTWANNLLFVPSLSIAGGTDEVLKTIIGERVLGLPKEPQVDRDLPFSELRGRTS